MMTTELVDFPRFESELQIQRDWFSRILHSLPENIIVYDADYNVVFSNADEKLWRGKKCYEFLHQFDEPCPNRGMNNPCAVREIIHRRQPRIEYVYDMEKLRYHVQAAPIVNPDGRRGAVEFVLDETKQRKLERVERELQETIRKLNALQLTRSFGSSLDIREIGLTVTGQLKKVIPLRSLLLCMHKGEIHSCHTFFPNLPGVQLYEERSDLLNREVAEVLDQQKIKCWCQGGEVHITLPLIYNGEAIGVWTVSLTKETYVPEHCQLLDTISDHLSSAIGHSLIFLTERRARAAREYLHSVLQSSRDGICIMRGDGEIRYLNDSIQLLMEMPQVICRDLEIFRQSLADAGPIRPKDIARAVEYVLEHGRWQAELDVVEEESVTRTFLVSANLIEREGEPQPDILWYAKEITVHRQLLAETRRAERLGAVAELASVISHEIRNPLAAIESAAEMLEAADLVDTDDRELLRIVQCEAKRVNEILNTYLQYARMNAPNICEVDVHDLLRETVQFVLPSVNENIEIVTQFEASTSMISADPGQLRQAFLNLIRNAIEAMPDGGRLTILTCLDSSGGIFVIRFHDTGAGIEPDVEAKLFQPFYSSKPNGSGMGLSIAQRVIQGHRGSIELRNHPEGGAQALIRLPL